MHTISTKLIGRLIGDLCTVSLTLTLLLLPVQFSDASDMQTGGSSSGGAVEGPPISGGVVLGLETVDEGPCSPMDPNFRTASCTCPPAGPENEACCSETGHDNYYNCPNNFAKRVCVDLEQKGGDADAREACCTAYGYNADCSNRTEGNGSKESGGVTQATAEKSAAQ